MANKSRTTANLVSNTGISTFTDLNITRVNITGVGTISNGSITNLTGTAATITTLRSTTLNADTGNIVTGVTTNFTSTNGSITNLTGTSSTITTLRSTTLNADTGNIVTGVTTNFTSTNATITNLTGTAGTITTLRSTTGNFTTGNIVTGVTTNFNVANVVITGVTTVSAGTTALPSISPSGDPNTGIFFPAADTIAFGEGGAEAVRIDSSGRMLVGTSSANANGGILQLKSGITFPATAVAASDANTLDDYEEGTWTPTIYGTTTAGTTTYFQQLAAYTKIGRVVTVQSYIYITNQTGTGSLQLGGLPFTAALTANTFPCSVRVELLTLTAGRYPVFSVAGGTTYIVMQQTDTGGGTIYDIPIDTTFGAEVVATYFV